MLAERTYLQTQEVKSLSASEIPDHSRAGSLKRTFSNCQSVSLTRAANLLTRCLGYVRSRNTGTTHAGATQTLPLPCVKPRPGVGMAGRWGLAGAAGGTATAAGRGRGGERWGMGDDGGWRRGVGPRRRRQAGGRGLPSLPLWMSGVPQPPNPEIAGKLATEKHRTGTHNKKPKNIHPRSRYYCETGSKKPSTPKLVTQLESGHRFFSSPGRVRQGRLGRWQRQRRWGCGERGAGAAWAGLDQRP